MASTSAKLAATELDTAIEHIVDLDLSGANCPTGTRLRIRFAVIEVTAKPHNGCAEFVDRFGIEAAKWINSRPDLRLRGINAVVVTAGTVSTGDLVEKR